LLASMSWSHCIFARLHWLILFVVVFLGSGGSLAAAGQDFDATNLRQPTFLGAKWLVQAGDNPVYVRLDFDDAAWKLFDPHTGIETLFPQHPEVIWFRLHVKVDPTEKGLALNEWNISRAFEIYVNGQGVMHSGQVAPFRSYTSGARVLAPIPDRMLASGSVVIAMRIHISRNEWRNGQFPGYYASNLAIGQFDTLYRENWLSIVGENLLDWIDRLLLVGVGLVALVLYAAQRQQIQYLWIFAMGAITLAELPVPLIASFQNVPTAWQVFSILLRVATPYLWVSLYFSFVHQRMGWRWKSFLIFAGVMNGMTGLWEFIAFPVALQLFLNLPFIILLSVVVPIVLAIHWRRGNREAGILLIPVLLFSLYIYAEVGFGALFQLSPWRSFALRWLNMIDRFPAGPFAMSLDHVAGILSTFSLAIIMLLRSTRMSRRQALLESELAAAREVQQVLVPEQTGTVPGFTVESVYQPAQQVGGDFFQIMPAPEGGLLVVVGDVAGKGLPAAMLVSVLVGAIRGVAEYTSDPAELLANLNERLVGRGGGSFSTALVAHIAADGRVKVANAGHLPPYLDGKEVELPGALPLGVHDGARYQPIEFWFAPGERLTFYSDGVVEAQNQEGELFGFERGRELSTQPAAAIVKAARLFGQQDDITVVTIERERLVETAA
jgi:sigma-B regulation protein RsbU (phosphoserine phosphatase)